MTDRPDPIEAYLDRLLLELRGRTPAVRRVLAEAEAHLLDAQAAGVASGLEPDEAARRAVERFGSATAVARRFRAHGALRPRRVTVAHVAASLWLVGAIGLISIGASGALAALFGSLFGKSFVAADPSGVTYTAARCHEYLTYEPHARTCSEAALAHHYGELVYRPLAAGGVGLLALLAYVAIRRRVRRDAAVGFLPDGFTATIGASLFGVAAFFLLASSVGSIALGGDAGAGAMLGQGIVAALAAAGFGWALLRALSARGALTATGVEADDAPGQHSG